MEPSRAIVWLVALISLGFATGLYLGSDPEESTVEVMYDPPEFSNCTEMWEDGDRMFDFGPVVGCETVTGDGESCGDENLDVYVGDGTKAVKFDLDKNKLSL